jgi:tRNA nucleotidyltransferase (CCA-adding enzyme)
MKIDIPANIKKALDILDNNGFEAFIVGGCVRDSLMGKAPNDFDVTTSARPQEIMNCFKGFKTVTLGIKHGTVAVIIDGEQVEITTYRVDGEYKDNRRPDSVTFTKNIKEDLSRRDFTINAIAYNQNCGLLDCFGGREDIENEIIRCVGKPKTRFQEDSLRILRGLRFASTLGFEVEESTSFAMEECKNLIKNISSERIFCEFKKLLLGENVESVLLKYYSVIGSFIPEILPSVGFDQKNIYHKYDVYGHTVKAICSSPYNEIIRLAMFFHDIGKPSCFTQKDGIGHFYGHSKISEEITRKVLIRLKVDKKALEEICTLVRYHDIQMNITEKSVRRLLLKFGEEMFFMLLDVKRADNKSKAESLWCRMEDFQKIEDIAKKILNEHQCISLKTLEINGHDIIAEGITDGREIGRLLKLALDAVIDGDIPNQKERLIELIRKEG